MAAKPFRVGDIVRLKSGGPNMAVNKVDETFNNGVQCVWFAGKKKERRLPLRRAAGVARSGRCWFRTSDPRRVKTVLYR